MICVNVKLDYSTKDALNKTGAYQEYALKDQSLQVFILQTRALDPRANGAQKIYDTIW